MRTGGTTLASAHGSLLASSHSEDPERPHLAVVCPLTTAACITQITLQPLSVGKSGACDDAALAHRRSSSRKRIAESGLFPNHELGLRCDADFPRNVQPGLAWIVSRLLLRWVASLSLPSTGVSARLARLPPIYSTRRKE